MRPLANPCILIIFGITGDLTKRLLFPAICNLGSMHLLNDNFHIIGCAIEPYDDDRFKDQLKKDMDQFIKDPDAKQYGMTLLNHISYISGDFDNQETYQKLKNKIDQLIASGASKNCLFYMAVPPQFIGGITTCLAQHQLLSEENDYYRRLVVEKPFGHDFDSAKKLNNLLLSLAKETQLFRIDHFLGKETVQNLIAFRFSNGLFEPSWNRFYIDHVQITVSEQLGVESRGTFYEQTGALRDMIPNHLFQLLSLIAMEPPAAFTADAIEQEKVKALQAVELFNPEKVIQQTVRGQYGPGEMNGKKVVGYRSEHNVSPQSDVETYVALQLHFDNWRWWHVPFYLRTGKRLLSHQSIIVVQFKPSPAILFNASHREIMPDLLRLSIQPDEGISLRFNVKIPGPTFELRPVEMQFKYSDYFGAKSQTGYEMIVYDCMNGDHLLFKNAEMIETGWKIVQPILDVWHEMKPHDFPNYAAGTVGPDAATRLLKQDGREWI